MKICYIHLNVLCQTQTEVAPQSGMAFSYRYTAAKSESHNLCERDDMDSYQSIFYQIQILNEQFTWTDEYSR